MDMANSGLTDAGMLVQLVVCQTLKLEISGSRPGIGSLITSSIYGQDIHSELLRLTQPSLSYG